MEKLNFSKTNFFCRYSVVCTECGEGINTYGVERDAVDAWNNRVEPTLSAIQNNKKKGSKMNVNFTVFIDKILSGEKRQTIRRASSKWTNVKAGDKLTLYTGLHTKQCRKLGEAVVESITQIELDSGYITIHKPKWDFTLESWQVRDFVKADGFDSVEDFWNFFKEHYGWEAVEMVVIKWRDFVPQTPPEDWNCTKQ